MSAFKKILMAVSLGSAALAVAKPEWGVYCAAISAAVANFNGSSKKTDGE